ncbi:ribonuclease H-like protein [Botryosphaeria dothidea]|uniref:Ribonuclease H-like protein n=1 Tax=Botryosphaeria dothidea TaxID=55169 RepID=A0A8H4N959_9PEZI|nr:ribonuclease H-like protein [Botryosphaeria dothidea]
MAYQQISRASNVSGNRASPTLSTVDPGTITSDPPTSSSANRRTRKRKATANTWVHVREPKGSEPVRSARKNEKIYYCKHCEDPTYFTTVSTTFRYRLLNTHGIELEAQEHPLKKQRKSLIKDAFAKAGEIDAVRHLSHGSIQKLVSNSFCVHKDILRKKLQSSPSKIHLSADVWSAPNHKAFLGTCVKFVDPDSKETLQALLALSELPGLDGPGSHGRAEQWKLLHHVLEDYNIWHNIGFYTGDNHGSNDKLCRLLSQHLKGKGINWDAKKQRIRCHGHVINLIVQAFLFVDSREAVKAVLEQIEGDDEAAFGTDFMEGFEAQRALG